MKVKSMLTALRTPGLQDGVARATEGEEAYGGQTWRTAKLDIDVEFHPSGIVGTFQRGYDRYYNKYIDERKGSISGINMVLAAYVVFSYCISYKELKHERQRKYH